MDEMCIDRRSGGKRCDIGQFGQGFSSTRLLIQSQRNKPELGGIPFRVYGIHDSLEQYGMLAGPLLLAAFRYKYGSCTVKSS